MTFLGALTICAALQTGVPTEAEAAHDERPTFAVPALVKQLARTNPVEERLAALKAIGAAAENPTALELRAAVEACLDDPDVAIRRQAAYCMCSLRIFHPFRCPDRILELLLDEDEDVRYAASAACSAFDTYSDTALPLLLRALESPDSSVRSTIPFELKFFAYRAPEAMAALRRATNDENPSVRNNATVALWHMTGDLDGVVLYWLECLAAKATGEPLRGVAADESGTTEFYAVMAASQFHASTSARPKELGVALAKQMTNKSPSIRSRAAHILGAMALNPEAEVALRKLGIPDRLKQMLYDEDLSVQTSAHFALEAFDPE